MADLVRSYRRWLRRRLFALAPAIGVACAVAVRQTLRLDPSSPLLWIDLACLGAATGVVLFCGFLALRCLRCVTLSRAGEYEPARQLRRELEPAGSVAMVAISLSVLIGVLPGCFPAPDPLVELPPPNPPAIAEIEAPPAYVETTAKQAAVRVPAPREKKPARNAGVSLSLPRAISIDEARVYEPQEEPPDPWSFERGQKSTRLGVPEAGQPFLWMDPEIHVDVLFLDPEGELPSDGGDLDLERDLDMDGLGLKIAYELPTDRMQSLRFEYQFFALAASQDEAGASESSISDLLVWQRLSMAYQWRLLGYTSDAPVDLSVFAGGVGDLLLADALDGLVSDVIRLSPYFGAEAGFWQNGPVGLIFRFGQTVPLNMTGGSSLVSELSAKFRVDFSNGLSLHVGYAAFWAHFRDYTDRITDTDGDQMLRLMMHGPTVGVDIRF